VRDPSHPPLAPNSNKFAFGWVNTLAKRESYQSAYCVMETEGKKDTRTLEKITGDVMLSLECLCTEETRLLSQQLLEAKDIYYFPAIATTAELQVYAFDPSTVSEIDGTIPPSKPVPVDFIRFRKGLATNLEYSKPSMGNLRESNQENERTVFVIQAKAFLNFLKELEPYPA
jgi:hypothetical protein